MKKKNRPLYFKIQAFVLLFSLFVKSFQYGGVLDNYDNGKDHKFSDKSFEIMLLLKATFKE